MVRVPAASSETPPGAAPPVARDPVAVILDRLKAREAGPVELAAAYQGADHWPLWQRDPRLYRAFGAALIRAGHPTRAFELLREGLAYHEGDHELLYWRALALARGGNVTRATALTAALLEIGSLAPALRVEALSLAGRLQKDTFERARPGPRRRRFAAAAAAFYGSAFELSGSWFPGINAATMSLLAGEARQARALAQDVLARASADLDRPEHGGDYWLYATLGEARIIAGDGAAAAAWYARAVAAARGQAGDLASMRRNLRLLRQVTPVPEEVFGTFPVGRVVVFSGHMVDHPDRVASGSGPARFPDSEVLAGLVARAIDAELDRLQPLVGFCSAACGGDILFAERLLARGAELHVLLPFDKDDFRYTSVDYGRPELAHWRLRFERVLADATEVHYATREHFLGDDVLFGFANTVLHGLALTRAAELDAELCGLLLLDETSQRVAGGTADVRAQWGAAERPARVIDLATLRTAAAAAAARPVPPGGAAAAAAPAADAVSAAPAPATVRPAGRTRRQVKVMLFSDVKNFSKLREEQTPSFFAGFLREVRRVIRSSPAQPEFLNTWGDGLFLVFDGVVECADFAMRLIDRIETIKWERLGLPPDTTVRIGIHAGPVYPRWDAIIERMNYFGSHVNRAARTEPVTTPGCAFTSEQFAALLAVAPDHDYVCEYVGVEQLAKEYDRCALYRLTRRPGAQKRRPRRPSEAAPVGQRRGARA